MKYCINIIITYKIPIQNRQKNMEKKDGYINVAEILRTVLEKKKLFLISIPIAIVFSTLIIICVPRSYTASAMLVPEAENSVDMGGVGSLASSFGINLNQMGGSDAISPLLYPELLNDNGFVASLLKIQVKTQDGAIKCSYYEYLKKHQKHAWWTKVIGAVKRVFKSKKANIKRVNTTEDLENPYSLSKEEDNIVGATRNLIGLVVDKKTGVITIHTEAQDPLISKSLADSVSSKLQVFITNYRTQKARHDVEYYKALTAKTKADYEKARQLYGSYSDANMDIVLESVRSKQADLENDMQLKFNAYTAMVTQLQAAEAKLRERTPAFTTLQGASVPIKPAKPRRMIFVLAITMLVFIGDLTYVLKGYILGKN